MNKHYVCGAPLSSNSSCVCYVCIEVRGENGKDYYTS